MSESRSDLRDYFEVSSRYIMAAALSGLYHQGELDEKSFKQCVKGFDIPAEKLNPVLC